MLYGIIGDIHSNYDALLAVVNDLHRSNIHKILCVGDIVGYAAEPVKCIDLIRELDCTVVAGNHDYAAIGKFPLTYFNHDAKDSILWTSKQLPSNQLEYLEHLPLVQELEGITIVHASLNRPEFFTYILSSLDAQRCFDLLNNPVCFFGHTHVPLAIYLNNENVHLDKGNCFQLQTMGKALVNVGSVGQPRDWDIRASYAVYDSSQKIVHVRRVKYDIHSAMHKIRIAGLPASNALRLME